jgi:hypothetical protein
MTTPDTLQTLPHEELVDYVQTRVTGTGPTQSTYRRAPGVLPVKIQTYPKKPRPDGALPLRTTPAQRWGATTASGISDSELTYEDLLLGARVVAA